MSGLLSAATTFAGCWGFAARSVILVFAGIYLMGAVLEADPERAKGLEGILARILQLPNGPWVLGFVALGLCAYGLFMVQAGLYRRHPY